MSRLGRWWRRVYVWVAQLIDPALPRPLSEPGRPEGTIHDFNDVSGGFDAPDCGDGPECDSSCAIGCRR